NVRFKELVLKLCNDTDKDVALKAKRVICSFCRYKSCHEILREDKYIRELSEEDTREGKYIKNLLFESPDTSNSSINKRESLKSSLHSQENHFKFHKFLVEVNGIIDKDEENRFITLLTNFKGVTKIIRHSNRLLMRFILTLDSNVTSLISIAQQALQNNFVMQCVIKKENNEILLPILTCKEQSNKGRVSSIKYPTNNGSRIITSQISAINLQSSERKADSFIDGFRSFFQNSFYW
ncbi:MAG: hypothetical protein MHMPM18_002896, partial [Marteilia pararefringens]